MVAIATLIVGNTIAILGYEVVTLFRMAVDQIVGLI